MVMMPFGGPVNALFILKRSFKNIYYIRPTYGIS